MGSMISEMTGRERGRTREFARLTWEEAMKKKAGRRRAKRRRQVSELSTQRHGGFVRARWTRFRASATRHVNPFSCVLDSACGG